MTIKRILTSLAILIATTSVGGLAGGAFGRALGIEQGRKEKQRAAQIIDANKGDFVERTGKRIAIKYAGLGTAIDYTKDGAIYGACVGAGLGIAGLGIGAGLRKIYC